MGRIRRAELVGEGRRQVLLLSEENPNCMRIGVEKINTVVTFGVKRIGL